MFEGLKSVIGRVPRSKSGRTLSLTWIKSDEQSWLARALPGDHIEPVPTTFSQRIEAMARRTNALGAQPLWEGYGSNNIGGPSRMPDVVRTAAVTGDFYSHLVHLKRPSVLVEFGTAFGVSGMYFLSGLESNGEGMLLTFEPNAVWADIAKINLHSISSRFTLTLGTFEENANRVLSVFAGIDMAFIDAIHTSEFVLPQLEIVISKSNSGALIILDDINFSDDMKECWRKVSRDDRFISSVAVGGRVGMLELR